MSELSGALECKQPQTATTPGFASALEEREKYLQTKPNKCAGSGRAGESHGGRTGRGEDGRFRGSSPLMTQVEPPPPPDGGNKGSLLLADNL